ncbi:prolactin-releasing peptide receptor [Eupeodes corollae]|uniref:prolactin-releasing peptide receptor n=1 Tax=Eupeodes corollae TaxID=290404 RepID=UPI00249237E5|nr:prolactin-releasing peptide receptor [Eupeodes corollae]XP_055907916.1 prolactin-releasing peptide receptor [Eupeodes corollae]
MQNPSPSPFPATSKHLVQIALARMNATNAIKNSFSYEYNNTMSPSLLATTTSITAAAARTMTTGTQYSSSSFLPLFSSTTTPSSSSQSLWSTTIAGGQNDTLMAARSADSPDVIKYELVQIFFCILYSTVFVLGVFGNVLVCYVVLRNRAMQTVTNIFITNLALSDILLCVLAVPFTPLYTFMGRWAFGKTLCHLVSFAQGCSIYISTLTLTSIAIDRYFVIIYPFHPRMKLSTCIAIIVSIWVISLLATLPYGMYMKVVAEDTSPAPTTLRPATGLENSTVPHSSSRYPISAWTFAFENTTSSSSMVPTYCEENWPSEQYRKVFGSVTTILQFVLPFFIISICYIWVSVKLNARARAKPGSKSSRREEADRDRKKRTNRMLISMVAVFGLSWLPINVVNILDDFYEKSNEWRFYTLFFFVAHSIAMSSTCYNPFLYAWLNENFRKEFKHVLPCFNPSNNNIINITRTYNRSDRNTCGPRLHHNEADLDNGDNNLMLTEDKCSKKKDIIIPREATYGNGAASITGKRDKKGVDILLNDDPLKEDNDVDSGDEQTVEMRFCETPFMSSDNTTGCSNFETSTTDNERTNVSLISN